MLKSILAGFVAAYFAFVGAFHQQPHTVPLQTIAIATTSQQQPQEKPLRTKEECADASSFLNLSFCLQGEPYKKIVSATKNSYLDLPHTEQPATPSPTSQELVALAQFCTSFTDDFCSTANIWGDYNSNAVQREKINAMILAFQQALLNTQAKQYNGNQAYPLTPLGGYSAPVSEPHYFQPTMTSNPPTAPTTVQVIHTPTPAPQPTNIHCTSNVAGNSIYTSCQ